MPRPAMRGAAMSSMPRTFVRHAVPGGLSPGCGEYRPIDGRLTLRDALWSFQGHAMLVWLFLPAFVGCQFFVPSLLPTLEAGYSNLTLIVLALVVAHHVVAESRAWAAVKTLLTRPEITVMHHLGVLRRRRYLLLLGIMEDLDIFTDLNFPCFAFTCDAAIHGRWMRSWEAVPVVGEHVVKVLVQLRFWGFSAILISIVLCGALYSLSKLMFSQELFEQVGGGEEDQGSDGGIRTQTFSIEVPRVSGEQFFSLAQHAETALMPSVAELCEEMGSQRQWIFDSKATTGGALGVAKAREDAVFGKVPTTDVMRYELQNEEEHDRVQAARQAFFVLLLLGRTLIGNALQIWIQASFFELAYDFLGPEASCKLLVGMLISGLQICVRCASASSKLGVWGALVSTVNMIVLAWAGAKVYFAYKCADHIWGVATGCVAVHLPAASGGGAAL